MALFKILKGPNANLPTASKEGWIYVTEDTNDMHIFISDTNKIQLNANYANALRNSNNTLLSVGEDGKPVYFVNGKPVACTKLSLDIDNSGGSISVGSISADSIAGTHTGTWSGNTIAVGKGGTGKTSWTKYGLVYASATTTLASLGVGTSGYVLTTKGSSAAPAWVNPNTLTVKHAATAGEADTAASADLASFATEAQNARNGVYYVTGNVDGTAGVWTGTNTDIPSLYTGLVIAYKIGTAGSSDGTTLNLTTAAGASGAIAVYRNSSTTTTHLGVGTVVLLTYDGTGWCWHNYDANTRNTVGDYRKNGTKLYFVGTTSSDASTSSSYATSYTNSNIYVNTSNQLYSAQGFLGNLTGDISGNATSADTAGHATTAGSFSSEKSIALVGDITGSASSTGGWSINTVLSNSGVNAGTYGPTDETVPAHGDKFIVPQLTIDAKGRVTSAVNNEITLPVYSFINKAATLSWNEAVTIATIGETDITVKLPANPNSDTKVTQTVTTQNTTYPLLLAPAGQAATSTTTAYFASGVTLNPSTNTIAANISGTAAQATNATNADNAANATLATTATRLNNTSAIGSSTKPVYFNANGIPVAGSTYAGGTAITLNGSSKASSTASFYAPTSVGTSNYLLKSNGSGAPTWVDPGTLNVNSANTAGALVHTLTIAEKAFNGTSDVNIAITDFPAAASTTAGYVAGYMTASDKEKLDTITESADAVSFSSSLSNGTKIGTITINGTATDLYCQTNTDKKVNVTLGTTTKAYLLGVSTTPTSTATALTTISDTGVYLDTTAGQLVATTFKGTLNGNASSATKLTSNAGSATLPIYFSGGKPVACETSLDVSITGNAVTATTADLATKAVKDADENVITSTYETKTDASAKLTEAKNHAENYADSVGVSVKNDLLNGAGAAYDTLKELQDAIIENADTITALETIASNKINTITASGTSPLTLTATRTTSSTDGTTNVAITGSVSTATTTAAGLMTAAMVTKLNGISESADAVSFTQSLTNGTKIGTIKINNTTTDIFYSGVISISTGSTNGTISVDTNGTTTEVAIAGLGSNAFTSTAYLPLTGGTLSGNIIIQKTSGDNPYIQFNNSDGTQIGYVQGYENAMAIGYNYANSLQITNSGSISLPKNATITPRESSGSVGTSSKPWSAMYATTFYGALSGNASTATKFASAQSVTLTGDVTGSVSSQAGWSIATTLANSGVTAGSYGPSANASPAHTETFSVPYLTVDAKGRVTAASTKTITLPSIPTIGNATITLTAGNGLTTGGSFTTNATSNKTITFAVGAGSGITVTADAVSVNTSYTTDGRNYKVAVDSTTGGLYVNVPWTDTNTKVTTAAQTSSTIYVTGCTGATTNTLQYNSAVKITGNVLYGAAWNDYAEYRISEEKRPGRVIIEIGDGSLKLSSERLQPGANIVSDTYGFAIGQTKNCQTPIAVSGRVLAYPYEDRNSYAPGDAVCTGPNGTVSKMTREEIREYPERIVGTVSEIPEYDTWGTGNVPVNGRIWIKVK